MRKLKTRRSLRYPVNLELKEVNGQPGADNYLRDISATGAKLDLVIPFILRDQVQFTFILPEGNQEISLGGQVVWVRPYGDDPTRYLIGLNLFQARWELDQLVRRWQGLSLPT